MIRSAIVGLTFFIILALSPTTILANEYLSNLAHYECLGGDFTLTSHKGVRVSSKELNKKILLLFFGYTTCPDICPTALTNMKQLLNGLEGKSNLVRMVFVTIDPERDTVEKLNSYIPFFHEDFIGLTGSKEEIDRVTKQFGARFIRTEVGSAAGYFFNHSDYIYLIDQTAKVRALYRTQTPTEQIFRLW